MNSHTNAYHNDDENQDDLLTIGFDNDEDKNTQPESDGSNLITHKGDGSNAAGQGDAGTKDTVSQKEQIVNSCQWLYNALPLRILSFSAVATVFIACIINLIVYDLHWVPSVIFCIHTFHLYLDVILEPRHIFDCEFA